MGILGKSSTIADVAKLAGVSKATVSRVINGTAVVSDPTRKKVESAMAELGFSPNLVATSLATGRTNTIGVLFTEPVEELYADPTFTSVLSGISSKVSQTDLIYALFQLTSDLERERSLRIFRRGMVDGLIHLSPYRDIEFLSSLAQLDIPLVLLGQPENTALVNSSAKIQHIYADDINGAQMAAQHVLDCQAKNIAFIMGPKDNAATRDRLLGYQNILGNNFQADWVRYGDWSSKTGRHFGYELLSIYPKIDTILCGSDRIARGVLESANLLNRKAGQDLLIIGFDNHPFTAHTNPTITTIAQPFHLQGEMAVGMLAAMLNGRKCDDQILDMWLVVRETTGLLEN